MFAMINTAHNTVALSCPQCFKLYVVDLAKFSEANGFQCGFRCEACNTGFIAKLEGPLRDAQLRNEADDAEQKSPTCNPNQHDWKEEYYGYKCQRCQMFIPYGSEPWLPIDE